MFLRSGLFGRIELLGKVYDVKCQGDYLIMYVDMSVPAGETVRVAFSYREIAKLLRWSVRPDILAFTLSPKRWFNKEPKHPEDY